MSEVLGAAAFGAVLVVVALYVFTDNALFLWLIIAMGVLELLIAAVAWLRRSSESRPPASVDQARD